MFNEVSSNLNFPEAEKQIREFWEANDIYEKSLRQRRDGKPFVFFEGPPTANGLPHPGHCLTRAMKDLFPRYKTMTGHYCLRKGGWDTHGLPVEVEVCKELGIHSKEQIEEYGVEPFNRKCLESVFRYTQQWETMTKRLGFWVNLEEAYVTYHKSYVESVWWSLKQLFDAGLLYQGHKIVWWWAQGGTALSSGEVGQGYREVDDPSVYVRFPVVMDDCAKRVVGDKDAALLVWTTTPWTLPSNMYAAVHNDFDYAIVHDTETDERLIFADALVPAIAKKAKKTDAWKVEAKVKGRDLVGLRYVPPFDCFYKADISKYVPGASGKIADHTAELNDGGNQHVFWRVSAADFVTLDSGSGLVHEAPAFGEVDYDLFIANRSRYRNPDDAPLLFCVAPNGTFTDEAPAFCRGRWVKEADKDISRDMKERGILLHQEQYRHDYPFCWRADEDPLIQYPRESWFIRTTQFKDDMLGNNQHINWLPDHIKSGRFGKFLESNVDWSLSRERYWGTPLPIWVCDACGHQEAIDSYDQLCGKPGIAGLDVWENAKKADPEISDHLKVHKPYIDAVSYQCPKCANDTARMNRVSEVIDCWYDSGAMPFAQWGWPHKSQEMFREQFPANFISEALDQTRGWFYSLTAISVMLFGKNGVARDMVPNLLRDGQSHPFETCIVLGLLLGEDGLKMSKSKKNYKQPDYIFDNEGADAMRWLFFSGQAPWTSIRFQESAIAEGQREFLIRLYNCYTFFVIYANIDKWTPANKLPLSDAAGTNELDRWILSELAACSLAVFDALEAYDNYSAARKLNEFVDALSNWYVRRCRDRFWRSEMDADKNAAYTTLHHCLVTLTKLIAPFTPFIADTMYQNLVRTHDDKAPESVHLCDYPVTTETRADVAARVDQACNREIEIVRQVVSCGRAARSAIKVRVRQPLATIELFHREADVIAKHEDTIKNELNVKAVRHVPADKIDQYVHYDVKPDFKLIGPKYGPLAPKIRNALVKHPNPDEIVKQLERDGAYHMTVDGQDVELTGEELKVELHAREGYAAERVPGYGIIVLDTHITPELRDEGSARDLVNQIQQIRKKQDLKYEQQIDLAIVTQSDDMKRVINAHAAYIQAETLAKSLLNQALPGVEGVGAAIDDHAVEIFVRGA
ncbi:MAG: isoleucine--tRNA ligase [Phycisphaerales bacterium]|nr:isoleucine--tRNA ligase [Phycisphaerales bacterium]MCB9854779.1 isoleucine--tRNA ligase [Phycisphaerales bacterium]MCB9863749.1 isoleucine--tRNA ligase [Phycisphaerales bacterium]